MSGVEVFKRLLPLAAALKLRLVIVNRRDYPGSSLYEGEELDIIKADNITGNDGFGRRQAGELARFIKTFIEKEDVPKPSSDGKDGGVVLLSWSSGNGYTLPLLAYPDAIPEGTREVIAPYLRLHIIFGASINTIIAPSGVVMRFDRCAALGSRSPTSSTTSQSSQTDVAIRGGVHTDLRRVCHDVLRS